MWPFKKGWTRKQKAFRRACREEEKEVEQLINWLEINMSAITRKNAQKAHNALAAGEARVGTSDPDAPKEDPSSSILGALPDETGAKEQDCCECRACPCHEVNPKE